MPMIRLPVLIYVGVGLFEELMRVYQVRNLAEGFHNKGKSLFFAATISVVLAAISSVIMHLSRPDPGFLTYVFITTSIYGFFYFWTGKAALAMAFHFAWDFTNSSIFALGSSASPSSPALFNVFFNSPAWNRPSLMMLLGVVGKIFGLAVVLLWLKLKDGSVKIDPGLFTPHFDKRHIDVRIEKERQESLIEHHA